MNFNFLNEIIKMNKNKLEEKEKEKNKIDIKNQNINNDELELAEKLNAIEEYTIDRFEENKVVLENRNTNEIKNIEKNLLPENCKEGDILKCINGKYFLDEEKTKKIKKEMENKYNNLWE